MSYEQIKEGTSGFRDIKKAIANYQYTPAKTSSASDTASASAPGEWNGTFKDPIVEFWTSAKGTKIRAKALKFANAKLTLLDDKGRKLEITLKQLDADSAKKAEDMIAAAKLAAKGA